MAKEKTAQEGELNSLHKLLTAEFRKILGSGCATASELNQIRQFLKDNEIQVDPTADTDVRKLGEETAKAANTLPFAAKPGDGFTEEEVDGDDSEREAG